MVHTVTRPVVTHVLKCWPLEFKAIGIGCKHHETRFNDRDFNAGDRLILREWVPDVMDSSYKCKTGHYTSRCLIVDVSYLSANGHIKDGCVVMSIEFPSRSYAREACKMVQDLDFDSGMMLRYSEVEA